MREHLSIRAYRRSGSVEDLWRKAVKSRRRNHHTITEEERDLLDLIYPGGRPPFSPERPYWDKVHFEGECPDFLKDFFN